jgi:O-antigen/teichoic acid export membrane protein
MPSTPEPTRAPGRARATLDSLIRRGAVYGIKAANLGAGVVVSLLLARMGGPEALGRYALAIQTAQLVSILAVLGCDQLMLREVAGNLRLGQRDRANSAIRHYLRFSVLPAVLVALIFAGVVLALGRAGFAMAQDPALIAAIGFLLANVFYLLGLGCMRGLGNPVQAQIYDGLFLMPVALVLGGLMLAGRVITPEQAVMLSTAMLFATMVALGFQVRKLTQGWGLDPLTELPAPLQHGLPMTMTSFLVFFLQWLPLFLAGALGSAADAGAFRAAWQLALPLAVIQATTVSAISAQVAGDLKEGRLDQAARRMQRNRVGVLALTLPLAVPLLIWPDVVMTFLFGTEFAGNGDIVRALVAINLFTISAGPLAAVITMAGRNRDTLPWGIASAALQLGLALWLLPRIGQLGLVISYGAAVLLRTASFWQLTRRILRAAA